MIVHENGEHHQRQSAKERAQYAFGNERSTSGGDLCGATDSEQTGPGQAADGADQGAEGDAQGTDPVGAYDAEDEIDHSFDAALSDSVALKIGCD